MPFAKVNDISMYYEMVGETGSPLILTMGLGGTKLNWDVDHVKEMATCHQVILFDNRGVGQTDKPETPYSMTQFATDTVGLLDYLGIEQAHVFGQSMGGMIAQHVAINYPERVLGLILGCTAFGYNEIAPPDPEVVAQLTAPPSGDRAADIRNGWLLSFTKNYIKYNRSRLEDSLQKALAYPEQPYYAFQLQLQATLEPHNTLDRLQQIKAPTLVQVGLKDILIPPENSRLLAKHIPNVRLIEYPEAAHAYFIETGDNALNDVLAFLRDVDQQTNLI